MQKVFQSIRYLNLAGTETVVMNWYKHIDCQKIQFDFGVNKEYHTSHVSEINKKGGRIFIIPNSKGMIDTLKYLFALYKTLKANGPYEVFHSHEQWMGGLTCFVARCARIKKRFIISHYADTIYNTSFKKKLLRPLARLIISLNATTKLAVSQAAGESLYGKRGIFTIIHNGIDLQRFSYNPVIRTQKRKELHLENKFVVGHIGRFMEQKNHEFLIDIFSEIYKQNPNAHLLLLGVGELEEKIRKKVKNLNLTQAVSFMGSCQRVQEFYQVFDVFILPSLYEGLPCVAVEAQGTGLPCFFSDTIARETSICNSEFLSLQQSPKEWATIILKKTRDFKRKDEAASIRKAGFDSTEVGQFIQKKYLE